MPIDPNIILQQTPLKFNDPFKVLQDYQDRSLQRQHLQQQITASQAQEEDRRQQFEENQKKQAEQDTFNKIIGNPALTPENFLETIRTQAPEHYLAAQKQIGEAQKNAADLQKIQADAAAANAKVQEGSQTYLQNQARGIDAAGNTPTAFELAMKIHEQAFPQSPTPKELRQYVLQQGPDAIKTLTQGILSSADQTAKAKLPGDVAQSGIAQQVAAGTQGGLTPEQRAQNARAAAVAAETARHNRVTEAQAAPPNYGGGAGPTPTLPPGQKDESYLATLPTTLADKAKALVEGRLSLPTRFTKGDTYWQGILDAATKYDPSFDAVNYNARAKARQAFTSGPQSQQVNALNTVVGHLSDLSKDADALKNTWSPTYNTVANMLTSASGRPEVKRFDATKNAVTDELTRVWRQAGGTEADIKAWGSTLDAAGSPEQMHGVIAQIGGLLESKLGALQDQYRQGMGTNAISVITPAARAALDRLQGKAAPSAPTGADTQSALDILNARRGGSQ
jgi:hypothetical protein